MIDEALFDAEEKMEKAVSVARDDLSTIRTGRANPGMFTRIVIDYYGTNTPITQLASINVPEARLGGIKPYETHQLHALETANPNPDPGGGAAAHGGGPAGAGQAGQAQGGRGPRIRAQHPPQGDGGTAPNPQGRRSRRGRRRPGGKGPGQDHPSVRHPDR